MNKDADFTAIATFTRTDGTTFAIHDVDPDSISASGMPKGIIGVEIIGKDTVIHVPFVQSWEIEYV